MATIQINDISIYCEIRGEGDPLILIHGLGSSTRNWELQVSYFEKKYCVITFDLRGHGRSSKPPGPYSMGLFAEDAAMLMQGLGVPAAHVAGISMGGMIAFELAVRFPGMLKSLVVINSYPEMRVETAREHIEKWQRLLILKMLGVRKMGQVLSKRLFIKPEQTESRRIFVEHWAQNDKRAYKASLRAIFGWDVQARLGEIRCPVLVIASDEDYLPLADKQAYVASIPNAQLVVVEDARHAVCVEKPEEFNRILDEFLGSLNGSSR